MTLALVCAGLLASAPGAGPAPSPDVARAYQEARSKAGRSPDEQVKLALWCEAHGLTAERLNHLALAVLSDPANATARGLMGLVAHGGRFRRPEAVAETSRADPVLAEYDAKRAKAPYTADNQWAMAVWSEEHGLKDQARAHFTAVIRLDPSRENAWRRLGYRKHDGRWITDAQASLEKAEADRQKLADRKWKPILERYKVMLGQPSRRAEAEGALAAITDPRAVPSIGRVFGAAEATQPLAVRLLGQVDSAAASRGLASLAVFAKSAEARRVAAETLRGRDAREYADLLIALIRDPIKYEVRPVGGPGSSGALFVEGKKANVRRIYDAPAPPVVAPGPNDWVDVDESGLPLIHRDLGGRVVVTGRIPASQIAVSSSNPDPRFLAGLNNPAFGPAGPLLARIATTHSDSSVEGRLAAEIARVAKAEHKPTSGFGFALAYAEHDELQIPVGRMMVEARKAALSAKQQLDADVATLDAYNQAAGRRNEAVTRILAPAAGKDLGQDSKAWKAWWVDQLGYTYRITSTSPVPTIVEAVPPAYQPQPAPIQLASTSMFMGFQRMSCFGAGTLVRTLTGPRPIESLGVGDRVLTQSTATAALGYQPILAVHHNPPSPTFVIHVAGDAIVSSPFHRFWKAGRGWVMAREIRVGDRLRLLDGVAEVAAVEEGKVQPVFNLDVAEDADFFAGAAAALVHDNTLPDPRLTPFDAPVLALDSGPSKP